LERLVTLSAVLAISFTQAQPSAAQASSAQRLGEARGFFALPVELDFDSGAANGDATILRMMPLYTFPVFDTWKLVNVTIFSMADAPGGIPEFPGDTSSGHTAGISDLLHASFVTPNRSGDFIWGAGVILALPIATDDSLGSDKWDAGPAFRLTYDVNQLLIRGAIRRQLPGDWFFVSAPLITANWDNPGEKWLVPVGGGIGRAFRLRKHPWAWSVQGYYNAIKPDSAPDWVLRFAVIAAIPFGEQ
jgi:hypothetical protein